jgi:hypothetical protein
MLTSRNLSPHNPIIRAELLHLRRKRRVPGPATLWARRSMLGSAGLLALFIFGAALGLGLTYPDIYDSAERMLLARTTYPFILLLALTLHLHFTTIQRTLTLAADTIRREKRSGTWESLLLTGVDARRLVLGKWWAVVRMVWRDYVLLAGLRAGVSVGLGAMVFANQGGALVVLGEGEAGDPVPGVLLAACFVIALTLVNGLFTTAAGVTGSLLSQGQSQSTVAAQLVRLGAVMIPVLLLAIPLAAIIAHLITLPTPEALEFGSVWNPLLWLQITFLDNGTLATAMIASAVDPIWLQMVGVALAALCVYLLLTAVLLRLGQWLARRQGVSSPA